MSVQLGQTLSHYRLLEKIGQGGMGVVYKAHDTHLKREVAVKILPDGTFSDEAERRRFRKEALALSKLNHPNIQIVHDYDTQGGVDFLVTEYIPGITLRDKLVNGPLPEKDVESLGIQIAQGLIAAHKRGVVHRDLKADNLRVTPDNLMKILDFGLAKFAQPISDLVTTEPLEETYAMAGTLPYMSPEQLRGDPIDERIDIYAAGVVLYEMATGRRPFEAKIPTALAADIQTKTPTPPSQINPDLPHRMEEIILKCLEKDPANRYQSVTELLVDIRRLSLPKPDSEPAPSLPSVTAVPLRWLLIGGPVVILALILSLNPYARRTMAGWLGFDEEPRHLAVLPFENIGGSAENQALCDGLMETLTSNLTLLKHSQRKLWVVPTSEVRRLDITSPGEARRELGVGLVISGSVQSFEDGFQLILNLIDFNEDIARQLDSAIIDSRVTETPSLQDETVIRIAGMLNMAITDDAWHLLRAGRTIAAGAYAQYLQGRGYLQRYEKPESIDNAILLFKKAIDKDPRYAQAYAALGEAYLRKYNDSKDVQWVSHASENCQRALDIDDALVSVHVTLGMVHEATGEYEAAVLEFQKALDLDPADASAHRGMARAYADLQENQEAEKAYLRAIEVMPEYWAGYNDLGLFYFSHARYEEALEQFQRVVEITPDNSSALNNLGGTYYLQERWAKAREMYIRSIQAEPNYRAYSNLGVLYYVDGQYAKAADMTEKSLELNATSYVTWANLGNAYYWIPDRERATAAYRRAAELAEDNRRLDPRDPYVLSDLAAYWAMIGDKNKSLQFIETSLANGADDAWVVYVTGHTYEQIGDREQALNWIGKAIDMGWPQREIENDPFLKDLRKDDRFKQLVRKDKGID